MTKKQQSIVNSKAYWEEVERKKQKLANQKPMTDAESNAQVAFLFKHFGKKL